MFKQIVTDVIGQQLENYIQNFDSNSIHFTGFPSSNLRLKNLRLKPDALSGLQLPVVLKHGYVGSLHIVIPFVGLKSTPVQVVRRRATCAACPYTAPLTARWLCHRPPDRRGRSTPRCLARHASRALLGCLVLVHLPGGDGTHVQRPA